MKKKKILVTGGAGFLGSHLCDRLLQENNSVICLDNLMTGDLKNISHLTNSADFKFLRHDVCSPIKLNVDQIYNLACPASPKHYQRDPIMTFSTNILGAMNMLELAKNTGSRILQASTSEVYGDPVAHPQVESYWGNVNPIGIRSCYDEGKRSAETLFFDYFRQHHVEIKVVRIFNTYGPRMSIDDGRVVSNFIVQSLRQDDITIYGNGMQTRSFCYVDDLITAMIGMMNSDVSLIGPVNIGNPFEFTVNDLAKQIISITGSKSKLVYMPLPADDPKQRNPDITLAGSALNWSPSIDLHEGLLKTIKYFQENI